MTAILRRETVAGQVSRAASGELARAAGAVLRTARRPPESWVDGVWTVLARQDGHRVEVARSRHVGGWFARVTLAGQRDAVLLMAESFEEAAMMGRIHAAEAEGAR